jgi:hypothetical protein
MNLWQARKKSMEWHTNEMFEQKTIFDQGLELLDQLISQMDQYNKEP